MEEETIIINEESGESVESEEDSIIYDSMDGDQINEEAVSQPDYSTLYSEQIDLTNHLLSGQIFFMGLIFGVLLFKVFWDRWKI